MKLRVVHSITYRYSESVSLAPHQILMRPRENHHVSVLRFRLAIEPAANLFWARDHHENSLATAYFHDRTDRLAIRAESELETLDGNPFDFLLRMDAVRYPFHYLPAEEAALAPCLDAPRGRSHPLLAWMRSIMPQFPDETLELLTQLNRALREQIAHRPLTPRVQTPEETIRARAGTSRDFAVLMMHACRALGLAARYVSGYRHCAPDERERDGGTLHAWTEVYLPGAGWKGLDPAHALFADHCFIPVAVGSSAENLNPVIGTFWGRAGVSSEMEVKEEVVELT